MHVIGYWRAVSFSRRGKLPQRNYDATSRQKYLQLAVAYGGCKNRSHVGRRV